MFKASCSHRFDNLETYYSYYTFSLANNIFYLFLWYLLKLIYNMSHVLPPYICFTQCVN